MVKLFVFVTLVAMSLAVEGFLPLRGTGIFRGDPFPDREADTREAVPSNIVLNTIESRVDNFDPTNDATWEQYYYSNDEFYQPGGPIFLFLAGEWDITPYRLTYSLMADMADELDGHIFYLEHRYYGQSRPVNDTSDANLRFLTVEQALADAAHFVTFLRETVPGASDAPVIVIGGHYSGSLAVWLRQKYPHLVTGAWASSAPLQALVNHVAYKEIAGAAYRRAGGNECYDTLDAGFDATEEYIVNDRNSEIEEIFRTCDPIVSDADEAVFFSLISEIFAIIPQWNHIYSLVGVCDLITNGTAESDVHRIARHVLAVADEYFLIPCVPSTYAYFIEGDRETSWDHPVNDLGIRPYSYQLCSQLGWYHSSDSPFQPFGSSFDENLRYNACQDVFGEGFDRQTIDENVSRFNTAFGALSPAVTNTIFVQGELDPWRSLGIQNNLNPTSPAIVIRGASQGNDLAPITDEDSAQLVAAKQTIVETITQWIQNA